MYCSSCGMEVSGELNYCNRCGANLNAGANLTPQVYAPPLKLTGPTLALGATVVLSLAAIFSTADKMLDKGMHPAALTFIIMVSMALVFGITGLIIRFWMTLLTNRGAQAGEQRPAQLKRPQANPQLAAPPTGPMNQPISSVTDHTTRTFEPVYRERGK